MQRSAVIFMSDNARYTGMAEHMELMHCYRWCFAAPHPSDIEEASSRVYAAKIAEQNTDICDSCHCLMADECFQKQVQLHLGNIA